jgi:hypothetical protein
MIVSPFARAVKYHLSGRLGVQGKRATPVMVEPNPALPY